MVISEPSQLAEMLGIPFAAEQLTAITAPLSPSVIVAGAGSGKTTVMAARVVWLVGSGQLRRSQVLGLTFTRKATAELINRVRLALESIGETTDDEDELILTYDSFAQRLVREYGPLLGSEPDVKLLNDATSFRLANQVVSSWKEPLPEHQDYSLSAITRRVLTLAREMGSHLVDSQKLIESSSAFLQELDAAPNYRGNEYAAIVKARQTTLARLELLQLVAAYQQAKEAFGYAEYSDLLGQAVRLAKELPEVSQALREKYRVVLLDEFQDTSFAQVQLLRDLFSGADAASGRGHPVNAVGDPSQAIYEWRGAAVDSILSFPRLFPTADGSPEDSYGLRINRRSQRCIVDAANQLAEHFPQRGYQLDLALEVPPQTGAGLIQTQTFQTWPAEIEKMADNVAALVETGQVTDWKSIAVLVRNNSQVGQIFSLFSQRDIPTEIVGLGGLLEVPGIADIVSILTLLHDPRENPAAIKILTSPRWAIGLDEIAALGERAKQLSDEPALLEAIYDPSQSVSHAVRQRLERLRAEFDSLHQWRTRSLVELVDQVITLIGAEVEFAVRNASAVLTAFRKVVSDFVDFYGQGDLGDLLTYFEAELTEGVGLEQPLPNEQNSVKLLTLHKAKGLEWDVVFLPALADGVFPSQKTRPLFTRNSTALPASLRGDAHSIPQLTEVSKAGLDSFEAESSSVDALAEDRLAYVGITRAKARIYGSTHVWAPERRLPRSASRYFEVLQHFADFDHALEENAAVNPLELNSAQVSWPMLGDSQSRQTLTAAGEAVRTAMNQHQVGSLQLTAELAPWARRADELLAEAEAEPALEVPQYLSVSALSLLFRDRSSFIADLIQPIPRPSPDSQLIGMRFHRWLERRMQGQLTLDDEQFIEPLPGDEGLIAAFQSSPYADLVPAAVEAPFTLTFGQQVIRGRIDAVFANVDGFRFQVVDWKTGDVRKADPLQLACYRLAWSQLRAVPLEQVDAVFYDLRRKQVVRPNQTWDAQQLEEVMAKVIADE
ncbi:MAG: ATP-dependent helicase [Propionibacteriaceae bacterium]|nr:ATP-dependent helicase [Propionibacteriaceae bacterium]